MPYIEIINEMIKQSQPSEYAFTCTSCKNYKGSLSCEKKVFIAFEGANLDHCSFYEVGRKCRHCGRIT